MTDKPIVPPAVADAMKIAPVSPETEEVDERELKHGREMHRGFKVGQYLQAPPFFFTRDKWPVPLVDQYRGATAFLIGGGPSFADIDKQKLAEPGLLTMGMNNSVKSFRPKLWTCVDDPANFVRSIWVDPTIQKIVPISHSEKTIFDSDRWQMMGTKVGDCPNVIYYKRNEQFNAERFLWEDTINWGNHTNLGGGRSVMLAAVRILFLLGVRRLYLLGIDFKMDATTKYHFAQDRSKGSIKGNNETYEMNNERFAKLRPLFEQQGFYVYNCYADSGLKAFDYVPFEEAYKVARSILPLDLTQERTEGLYDRKSNERAAHRRAGRLNGAPPPPKDAATGKQKTCANCSRKYVDQVNAQLNAARTALHEAKNRTEGMRQLEIQKAKEFTINELNALVAEEDRRRKAYRQLLKVRDSMTVKTS